MSISLPLAFHRSGLTGGARPVFSPSGLKGLPEPEFPRKPEPLTQQDMPGDGQRHWTPAQIYHAARGWAFPYFKSRLLPGDVHPIVANLFTRTSATSIATTATRTTIVSRA